MCRRKYSIGLACGLDGCTSRAENAAVKSLMHCTVAPAFWAKPMTVNMASFSDRQLQATRSASATQVHKNLRSGLQFPTTRRQVEIDPFPLYQGSDKACMCPCPQTVQPAPKYTPVRPPSTPQSPRCKSELPPPTSPPAPPRRRFAFRP